MHVRYRIATFTRRDNNIRAEMLTRAPSGTQDDDGRRAEEVTGSRSTSGWRGRPCGRCVCACSGPYVAWPGRRETVGDVAVTVTLPPGRGFDCGICCRCLPSRRPVNHTRTTPTLHTTLLFTVTNKHVVRTSRCLCRSPSAAS